MFAQFAAVGIGSAIGAWLRWGASAWLNPKIPLWPLGTIAANLVGGFLVGFAIAFFAARPEISPEWRLFAITGFLGGLTTFSTFSAEVTQLMMRGDWFAGMGLAAVHLIGSLVLTVAGIATFRLLAS
jgi:CrcB protein